MRFYWGGTPDRGIASAIITYNTWIHVAFVYTGTRLYTYIDGVFKDEVAVVLGTANNPMLRLGRDQRTGATAFSGSLNDIRIYDEALGVAEIKEISRALVLHYDFNDPDVSTIVYDSSGYGRHGIISSATAPTLSDESICGPYSMEWGEGGNTKLITLPTLPFATNCTVVY